MNVGSVRTYLRDIVSHQYTGPAKIFVRKEGPNNYTMIFKYSNQPLFNHSASSLPGWVWVHPGHAYLHQPWSMVQSVTQNGILMPNTPRRRSWSTPKTFKQMGTGSRQFGKLINRVFIPHRLITAHTNWSQVWQVGRSSFAFRNVVSALEIKDVHHSRAPRHGTFVFEFFTTPRHPHLLTKRFGNFRLHILYLYI